MRFGLFNSAEARRDAPADTRGAGFTDYVEMNVEAEALGYHASFLVEHHFTGVGQVSASLNLLTWVAARTSSLRLGTAVIVLPWHNPVLLAEQAATLDLLSGGRLDFGVGKGYRHSEFAGFCLPMEEAEGRFEESLAVIRKAWTSETRFSHQGRFWQFEDILVEPPTRQKPHPPLWIAAGNPASIAKVAERGCNLLLDQFASPEQIRDRIGIFKAEVEARGRRYDPFEVAVARNVYVAKSAADKAEALERQARVHKRMVELSQRPDGANKSHILQYADRDGGAEANALYGTAEELARQLEQLQDAGVRYVLLNGGRDDVRQTVRRFAETLMPAFRAS